MSWDQQNLALQYLSCQMSIVIAGVYDLLQQDCDLSNTKGCPQNEHAALRRRRCRQEQHCIDRGQPFQGGACPEKQLMDRELAHLRAL